MSRPIDEKTVHYGDVFEWDDRSLSMFICWSPTRDNSRDEGRVWVSLQFDALDGELAGVIMPETRGFKARNRTHGYAWRRADVP